MKKIISFILILTQFFAACTHKSQTYKTLEKVDKLLYVDSTDNAENLLSLIDKNTLKQENEITYYNILKTVIDYRHNNIFYTDSVIDKCVNYSNIQEYSNLVNHINTETLLLTYQNNCDFNKRKIFYIRLNVIIATSIIIILIIFIIIFKRNKLKLNLLVNEKKVLNKENNLLLDKIKIQNDTIIQRNNKIDELEKNKNHCLNNSQIENTTISEKHNDFQEKILKQGKFIIDNI